MLDNTTLTQNNNDNKKYYKDISYLKNHDTISKYCTKHSELENIKKIRSNHDGVDRTIYKVVKDVENISSTED
ncbi:MAG: hypothetical protein HOA66_00775 [Candidatus Marinimicrobia bacterium]|nr:hypothetical protein [Candidatus Neomarinimicrobiota bacterium]